MLTNMYRIGVDVGGTNTDAALLDVQALNTPGRGVIASHKTSTTPDITSGITNAIRAVLAEGSTSVGNADLGSHVLSVTIGTTHFVNALIEADARRLSRVAVVRLCGPYTRMLPPFTDFPKGLRQIIEGGAYYLGGGLEVDGREITPLDRDEVAACVKKIQAASIDTIAIVGVFSPLDTEGRHEDTCKKIIAEIDPSLNVVCSHGVGPPGLLARENATILNAAILATARRTISGFGAAMRRLRLGCPLYLSQNDGTLISAEAAAAYPIKTFASGPTNSMTGAAFLAGLDSRGAEKSADSENFQTLVVDIGGTTTDVCALLPSGFPRPAPNYVDVGGVRTAFAMPEVVSIGLGGGSKVKVDADTGTVTVGPDSVGHRLTECARIFGGSDLTTSDIAVASGDADELGDPKAIAELKASLPASTVAAARATIRTMLEKVVDQMRVSAAPIHVLLVGGGSLLLPPGDSLSNVARCTRPIHHGAANAVGAAIAKVSGEVDTIVLLEGRDERDVVDAAKAQAVQAAVDAGADAEDVRIVAVESIPLQYVHNKATRLIVKAVGRLATPTSLPPRLDVDETNVEAADAVEVDEGAKEHREPPVPAAKPALLVDLSEYRPEVCDGVWYISEVDLDLIATGTGVLGTGGGGPSYQELLHGLHLLEHGGARGKMRVVAPPSLDDDALVCFGSWYGAPSVINERISSGGEITKGIDMLKAILHIDSFQAVLTDEIGGGNGMSAFATGVHYDIPVVDGDAMGRAYPTMYHAIPYVYGQPIAPCALSDAQGNVNVIMSADSPERVERLLRTAAVELGLGCAVCAKPLPGNVIKKYVVPNTISQAWYLGRAVHIARRSKTSLTDAIFATTTGKVLFTGKIVSVSRDVTRGYTMGRVLIAPVSDDGGDSESAASSEAPHMLIPFQNEYLYAAWSDAKGTETRELVCTVPDLISILGHDGEALGSQELRYGLRVTVIGMPAHPLWKTEKGLAVGGPAGFDLDIPFTGVGEYSPPRSVIEEYGS
ncbi:hydantoinase [Ophiostoma piceae UAMH 11346]|uniref:Hydantoinase n=1 Tax=Ophiostoma piceae (strain UAMH 11346) TaxID=1262450 RepID=S3CD65_OPHP1|nr:hydantoinase [Ophiostoma piceae UAMH 11346]